MRRLVSLAAAALAAAVVLVAGPAPAHAGPNPAALRKAFDAYLRTITDDAKTSAAMMQGCQVELLPAGDGLRLAPTGVTATELVGAHSGAITWRARDVHVLVNQAYWGTGFVAADVDALDAKKKVVKTLRVSALMYDDKAWNVVAIQWGAPLADAKAAERALAGAEPKVAAVPDKIIQDTVDKAAEGATGDVKALSRDVLAGWMEADDAWLLGSAPGEHVAGGGAGKKAVAGWKLELANASGVLFGSPPGDTGAYWLVANVTARSTYKGKPVTQTYRTLLLFETVVVGESGVPYTYPAVIHFASPE